MKQAAFAESRLFYTFNAWQKIENKHSTQRRRRCYNDSA